MNKKINKKVLVTGANGFIGRTVAEYLMSSGYDVTGLIRLVKKDVSAGSPASALAGAGGGGAVAGY
ncbi:MAG: NAD-dependent epimerase/dehydratase family protein, partial [Holosporales bacterium]|nr:NAD-dependent epimerase/dehydratase family protein [Holosporales bacterium]